MRSRKALKDAIDIYSELLRVHQLNLELLNTLEQALYYIQDFCQKHNVPFYDEKLSSILSKIERSLDEISNDSPPNVLYKKLSDESKQHKDSDGEVTEPLLKTPSNIRL